MSNSKSSKREEKVKKIIEISGFTREYVENELELMKKEYDITPLIYINRKLYELPEDKRYAKAERIRKRRRQINYVAEQKGISFQEALAEIEEAKEKFGIKREEYISQGYYRYEGRKQELYHQYLIDVNSTKEKKSRYRRMVSEKTGWDKEKTKLEMNRMCDNFNITESTYYNLALYDKTEARAANAIKNSMYNVKFWRDRIIAIGEETGKSRQDVFNELKYVKGKNPASGLGMNWYYGCGIYQLRFPEDDPVLEREIELQLRRLALEKKIRSEILSYREGKCRLEGIKEQIAEYTELVDRSMSSSREKELSGLLEKAVPDVLEDEKLRRKAALDIEVTRNILDFTTSEYITLRFFDKSFEQKLEFVSQTLRNAAFKRINPVEGIDLLVSKYDAYLRLKDFYGRNIVRFDESNTFEDFAEYCKNNSHFLKKNNYGSFGRGVIRIDIKDDTCLKNIYEDIIDEGKMFILEDLITADKAIAELNPDSVNTIRIVTYRKGRRIRIQDAFMKIGRKGSIVDNGGAGGIFVHVDKKRGVFDSNGIDEAGLKYEVHPDHGYAFKGIVLPEFKKALKVAKEAAKAVPEAAYVGWDLTYTADGDWVIVEGNSYTQFLGQQGTIEKGCRKRFLKELGFTERELIEE